MKKGNIFVADLTHTGEANIALTFPLGAAFVTSYAQKCLGEDFDFKLFKFSEPMAAAIVEDRPSILAFSNYQWSLGLTYKLCEWAKRNYPEVVIVFGGPNFPVVADEKVRFFKNRPLVDFHIEYEGELGFVALLKRLQECEFDVEALKKAGDLIPNCTYLHEGKLVQGPFERIRDINAIPSPYLNGIMDPFFDMPLVPMIETTRGCPFSCSFCADGMTIKSRIFRVSDGRTKLELNYIHERVKDIHEIIITDLNFGMYEEDVATAQNIADIQEKHDWPLSIQASAGKNKPEKVLKVAGMLHGAWVTGSAIQSSDPEVLKNVKRNNISLNAYKEFTQFANSLDAESTSYTEIILALPGDTKEKHFNSLRYSIECGVSTVHMYQAILLAGTEMASEATRKKFGLLTKFRIIPGGLGIYKFGEEKVAAVEIEEIIVGSDAMSVDDYTSCRVMNLLIEILYNNSLCEEIFSALKTMGIPLFDFLLYVHTHEEFYSPKMNEILASFRFHTKDDLYDSHEEAESSALSPELLPKYLSGELGANELTGHKAGLYSELDDVLGVMTKALKAFLAERGMLNDAAADYFDEVKDFILCRKRAIQNIDIEEERSFKNDFKALEKVGYAIDPREIKLAPKEIRYKFAHNSHQKDHIRTALNVYGRHPSGIARVVKRANLKKLTRHFEVVSRTSDSAVVS